MINEERNKPGVKTKTVLRHLAGVRRYLEALGIASPLASYKPPVAPLGRPHPLEGGAATIDKMVELADGNCSKGAMLALTGYMGFRISEARTVRVEHIDLETREVLVRGKGDVWDRVLIPRKALALLFMAHEEALHEGREFLIDGADRTVRAWFSTLAKEALGRPLDSSGKEGSHSARHAVGTDVYNSTKDLLLTSRVLRQHDPRTTVGYVKTDVQEMLNALNNRTRGTRN